MALYQSCGIYKDGTYYPMPHDFTATATVAGGNAVFYLTDTGTSSGNAVFSEVFLSSMQVQVQDSTALFQAGAPTLSPDKKTLTVPITRFAISTSAVTLLGISVLGSISQTMTPAPNGTVAALLIEGIN